MSNEHLLCTPWVSCKRRAAVDVPRGTGKVTWEKMSILCPPVLPYVLRYHVSSSCFPFHVTRVQFGVFPQMSKN